MIPGTKSIQIEDNIKCVRNFSNKQVINGTLDYLYPLIRSMHRTWWQGKRNGCKKKVGAQRYTSLMNNNHLVRKIKWQVYTFSRNTKNGYWTAFKLWLTDDGCIWTSRLPSYHRGRSLLNRTSDGFLPPRAPGSTPSRDAATLGYRPAHITDCTTQMEWRNLCTICWHHIHLGSEKIEVWYA